MGKKTPSAPAAPDPVATAAAQGTINADTARLNAQLNRVNQVSPYGTVNWSQNGDTWTQTIGVPQATQDAITAQQGLERDVSNLALTQTGRIADAMAQPFNVSGQPSRVTSIGGNLPAMGGAPTAGAISGTTQNAGSQVSGIAPAGQIQTSAVQPGLQLGVTGAGGQSGSIVDVGNVNRSVGDAGAIQRGVETTQLMSSLPGAGRIQSGFNPGQAVQGNLGVTPQASINAGNIQRGVDLSGAPAIPGTSDFSADRARVEEALLSRLSPQFQRDRETLETRLANQGIVRGTPAFNEALDELNRAQTDARMQAVLSGGQEQSRLFGMGLQARQQGTNELFNQGNFANQAQAQAFGQGTTDRQRLLSEALAGGQFANQAAAQQFGQNQTQAAFGNQAQQQRFAQNLAGGQFANEAARDAFNQNVMAAQFGNDAQAQLFAQNMAGAGFQNQAQQQAFDQAAARLGAQNAAQSANFGQNIAAGQFGNEAAGQLFGMNMQNANLNNTAQAQQFGQNAAQQQAFNQASTQALQNELARLGFGNEAQNQAFSQGLSAAGFQNQTRQQALAEALAMAQFQNDQRAAGIQEQAYLRQLPINEMAALLANGQVNLPQFQGGGQVNVAAPDYAGLVGKNYASQMNNYNQQMAARNSTMGGLFGLAGGLGSAAIMASDRRVKRDIVRIGTYGRRRVPVYAYRYLGRPEIQIGVMAQEVAQIVPEAVSEFAGIKAVNYDLLLKEAA